MIVLKRILPILGPLALVLLLEVSIMWTSWFWSLVPLLLFFSVVPAGALLEWRVRTTDFWYLMMMPALFVLTGVALLVFLSDTVFSHFLVLFVGLLVGWYLENLFLFHYRSQDYQPYSIENGVGYLSLLVVFFGSSSLFAARIFLNLPLTVMAVFMLLLCVFVGAETLWSLKASFTRSWPLMTIQTVALLELFVAVVYLPTSFFVAGLCITIPYYVMTNIIRHILRGAVERQVLQRYALIGGASLALTLLTAPWQ